MQINNKYLISLRVFFWVWFAQTYLCTLVYYTLYICTVEPLFTDTSIIRTPPYYSLCTICPLRAFGVRIKEVRKKGGFPFCKTTSSAMQLDSLLKQSIFPSKSTSNRLVKMHDSLCDFFDDACNVVVLVVVTVSHWRKAMPETFVFTLHKMTLSTPLFIFCFIVINDVRRHCNTNRNVSIRQVYRP